MTFTNAIGRCIALAFVIGASHAAELRISVRHGFLGAPLLLDSLRYQNAAGETLSVTRLSYLLSGFAVEREGGGWIEVPGQTAWIDAEKRRTVIRLNALPDAKFRALRFHVGPGPVENAADVSKIPAGDPLNPNLDGLHWSWQGGYIFMAVEGHFRTGIAPVEGYAYHLARDPNRTTINLAAPLDLAHNCSVQLDFDLGALFNAPRAISFAKDGRATHSRDGDSVSAALVANLPGAFHVARVLSSAPAAGGPVSIKPLDLPDTFTPYHFIMGGSFPVPDLPRDNPLIEERVALGRKLFHETALSRDGTISCASCHVASSAFSDPRRFSIGVRGQVGARNAMPLFNLAWKSSFFWDGRAPSLRAQALLPIQNHAEMDETLTHVTAKLAAIPEYHALFRAAFKTPGIDAGKIGLALEQYLLTLTAHDAKFDRVLRGKATFTGVEKRGLELFMTEYEPRTGQFGADCFHCHGGPLFSDHQFHNNGLGGDDPGRANVTRLPGDAGKFSTPSLRNVARTAPYMHDGRFHTLEEVIEHYSSGVRRSPTLDPNLAKHPDSGLQLGAADKAALVAFLKTLTDEEIAAP